IRAGRPVRAIARDLSTLPPRWFSEGGFHAASVDLCEVDAIAGAIGRSRRVVWLAHIRSPDPRAEVELNAHAIDTVCGVSGIEKIVLTSSGGSVYGNPERVPVVEDHTTRPLSTYGKAKCAMEDAVARRSGPNIS